MCIMMESKPDSGDIVSMEWAMGLLGILAITFSSTHSLLMASGWCRL